MKRSLVFGIALVIFLLGLSSFVVALSEEDKSCSNDESCRPTSCGDCVNINQEELIFCERPTESKYPISCTCENSLCAGYAGGHLVISFIDNISESGANSIVSSYNLTWKKAYSFEKTKNGLIYVQIGDEKEWRDILDENNQIRYVGLDYLSYVDIGDPEDAFTQPKYYNMSNGRKAEIKIMPETASQRAIERLGELNFTTQLKEVGKSDSAKVIYELTGDKEGKFLGIFKIIAKVRVQVDAENGDVKVIKPWWSFLASGI